MKSAMRSRMKALRRAVPATIRRRAAQAIRDEVLGLGLPGPVMAYISVRAELGTRLLIDALPGVAVPRVVGDRMECRLLTRWIEGVLGIPTTDGPIVEPAVVLLPGLAFDDRGGRLGYGGGFYDRFLSAHPEAHTIALGYDFQRIDGVPMEPHDVRIDRLITVSTQP